jgi:hypothetical protein
MQFKTSTFTYSGSLQSAQQALLNFRACMIEAGHLNAATAAPGGAPKRQ